MSADRKQLPPAIFLMGPTASGKTALALEIVRVLPCEIISVDSAQVYRHLNIGTAKPDPAILKAVPHHLIDRIDPDQSYSAARFRDEAREHMLDITRRGKIPLLVGGTMLYFKALSEGLAELPPADPIVRRAIERESALRGWPALHQELHSVDPKTAARLAPGDAQRIQRALEVYYVAKRPLSELIEKPVANGFPYQAIKIALLPSDRSALHANIALRFEAMLAHGLVEELRGLRQDFALKPTMPSMRCVGYRQAWRFLDCEIVLSDLREQGIAATRQLAKRQMTWMRATQDRVEFDCLAPDIEQRVLGFLRTRLPISAAP